MMDRPQHNILIGFKTRLFSDGLECIVNSSDGYRVLYTFPIGDYQIEDLPSGSNEHILILELNCPTNREIEYITQLKIRFPAIRILVISLLPRHHIGITLIESGISAYILKSCGNRDLFTALNKIVEGKHYYCSDLTESILSSNKKTEQLKEIELTDREKEILGMLVGSMTNKNIAIHLNISENTVKTHRKNIQAKFGVSNLIGMVRYACRSNLIEFGDDGFCMVCPYVN